MQFIVSVDFVTQIITNSSSVVYSYADDNAFETFVNELFKTIGVEKTCKDVFDLYVLPDDYDYFIENCEDEVFQESLNGLDYRKQYELAEQYVIDQLKQGKSLDYGRNWIGYENSTQLLVVLKDGQPTALGGLVQEVFSHEASYDG